MPFLSWLGLGSKPKSPALKEAEAAFSDVELKDISAHYDAIYNQLQATYPGGRAAAPKGLDAAHLGQLVGPLWGCLDPLLAAEVFSMMACPDTGLVHLEQVVIAKARLERLGEEVCLDATFRMLDVHREGALRADALAAGIVSGVRMSLAAAAAVNAAAAAVAAAAGGADGAAGGAGAAGAGAGAGQGAAASASTGAAGGVRSAAAAIAEAAKSIDGSLFLQQALAVCRGALLPQEAASVAPDPSAAPGNAGWTPELKAARMGPDDYRRWSKRCPALRNALAGLLRHVGSAAAAAAVAAPGAAAAPAAAGTAPGTAAPGQAKGQGRGGVTGAGAGAGAGGGQAPTTPTSSGSGSPHTAAQAVVVQQYRAELPPLLTQLGKLQPGATLLQPVWTWLLSARLPPAQRCEWRLLFSSARDGKSFNTFFGRVTATPGPTLLLIKDKGGALFGGYASQPWAKSGNFYGDVSCAIFSLLPAMQVYPATGINDNIQWCGVGFSQLPGGLGFGGAAGARGHFALYVEPSLDSGMSRPIATFGNSASLASEQVFQIDTLECWLLQPPEEEEGSSDSSHGGPRRGGGSGSSGSILDKAAEDRALMKMAGMQLHSEGVRDEPLEED
ncbi:hypothetical protein HYH02_006135 [Chlamydomonas schloesseri]|uniref:TLDc domain-containing protein n=1 Tax=Chlamydomonas schloesseri TaxID=2026947 RepID=A0A835WJG1_9CHLO|nr:hypothetical protein HYH02_006135 [Chlamydomonas schloesseri]|eukprot:KAG2448783.1 hypothetical protein HYH02_006135 [Chlamydomonas schloesseri]